MSTDVEAAGTVLAAGLLVVLAAVDGVAEVCVTVGVGARVVVVGACVVGCGDGLGARLTVRRVT